jgi:hypothetical protein
MLLATDAENVVNVYNIIEVEESYPVVFSHLKWKGLMIGV